MSEKRPFVIQEPPVSGEIQGNANSKKIVVFSHGFGVQRDSRGMFTELAQRLGEDHLVVLFDYVDVDKEGNTTAHPLTEQSDMLNAVLKYVREIYQIDELSVVAHSQGCLVVCLANAHNINTVVLNAPPMASPNPERMQKTFGSREGTHITTEGTSTIQRSDGTTTYIPASFWNATSGIDPAKMYADLASQAKVYFVRANQDHVLSDQDYSAVTSNPDITFVELDGNHDFADDARVGWLNLMVQLVEKP